jgi:hypothetical protein
MSSFCPLPGAQKGCDLADLFSDLFDENATEPVEALLIVFNPAD